MKRVLLWLMVLVGCMVSATNLPQEESQAEQILTDLYASLQGFRDIRCEVDYEIRTPNRAPIIHRGYLKYQQDGRYHLQLADQQICYDGEAQIVYLPAEQTAYISNFDPLRNASMVEAILGLFALPSRKFLQEPEVLNGHSCYKVYLVMEGHRLPYTQAFVWIDTKDYYIHKVSFLTSAETLTAYTFRNPMFNTGLRAEEFLLDLEQMPELTILDQR